MSKHTFRKDKKGNYLQPLQLEPEVPIREYFAQPPAEPDEEEQQYFRLHKFKKRLEHTWGPEAIKSFLEILDEAKAEDFWVAKKPIVQVKLEKLLGNMDTGDVPHIIDQYNELQAEEGGGS
jgi:hypothetical protein